MASITIEGPAGAMLVLETVSVPIGVQGTRTLTAGAGLTGGGDMTADRAFAVGQGAGIVVSADAVAADLADAAPPQVTDSTGAVGTGTQLAREDHTHAHGNRGGGSLHAAVIAAGASGFMTGADKTKLDGVAASAAALTSSTPAAVGSAAVGVATTAARADHVHAHGNQAGGSLHALAIAAGAAGFLSGADKTKIDQALLADGTVPLSAAWAANGRIYHASAALNLGTSASSGHSLGTGDVLAGGKLEVDGQTYHDADVNLGANTIRWTGPLNTGKKFLEITPATGPGKYNFVISDADNPGDPTRKDHVMFIGYNVGSGGGPEAGGESQFSDQWESHWDDGGGIIRHERHMRYTTADGLNNRAPFSFEIQISGGASPYYVTGAIRMDQFIFGPNTTGAVSRITITSGNIVDCDSTVQIRKVGGTQWLQHFTGSTSNVYENLIYLDTSTTAPGQFLVVGGQTFGGIKLGVPLSAGRALSIIGNDCDTSSNQAGGDLTVGGGRGRGTGAGGKVILATAPASLSGGTQNALVARWQVDSSGNLLNASTGYISPATNVKWLSGANTPEGAVTAAVGSLYTRTDGGANTTLYVKETGAGNTGWVAK